jgi:lipoprotein-anchoring transpeptidase ErfK/SrfK
MRAMDIAEDDVNAELAALNAAIAHIESDIAGPVEAALRAARPRPPTAAAVRPAAIVDSPPGVEQAAALGDAPRTPGRAFSARMLAAVLAVIAGAIIAMVGYAYLPRTGARQDASQDKTPAEAVASRTRTAEPGRQPADADEATLPYMLRRQLVFFRTTHPAGTIIIIKPQHFLYLVKDNEAALRYTIGVGADCDGAAALLTIAGKEGGPDQAAPVIDAADKPPPPAPAREGAGSGIPTFTLADTTCRIRATNAASVIGRDQSRGGFQLIADDMLDLYERVPVGTKVVIMN